MVNMAETRCPECMQVFRDESPIVSEVGHPSNVTKVNEHRSNVNAQLSEHLKAEHGVNKTPKAYVT